MWPFSKPTENRASYTETIVNALVTAAGANAGNAATTAAVEAAASMLARAFASATVSGTAPIRAALTPAVLSEIGRRLIVSGNSVWLPATDTGGLRLAHVAEWDITGRADPNSWRYVLTLDGPTATRTVKTPGQGVIHFRYAVDPRRPWEGLGPLQLASTTAGLAAATDGLLRAELESGSCYVCPAPLAQLGASDLAALQTDLKAAKGRTALVPSMSAGWNDGTKQGASSDWKPSRIGGDPPASVVTLMSAAGRAVLAATGTPVQLFDADTEGTGRREAWRQYLHGTVQPLARIVAAELSAKLDSDIALSFEALFASDIQGRARAFQSMVNGGMEPARAAGLSGLLMDDSE